MTNDRTLKTTEIDDGWFLDEDDETYAEYVLETPPSSGFEQAFWEQVEGRRLARGFGDVSATFGVLRLN